MPGTLHHHAELLGLLVVQLPREPSEKDPGEADDRGINVIELHVPSLRERGDDIMLLAGHILARLGSSSDALDASARAALRSYHFPGNVRELENMLERAVTLCVSGIISESDLALRPASAPQPVSLSATTTDLGFQVEDVQRQAIVDALQQTRYNKTAAAKLLGLTFRQLRYLIKKLGIH